MKKILLTTILLFNLLPASEECKQNEESYYSNAGDKSTLGQEIDRYVIPPLQEIINQYLIGDDLETSKEFIKALQLKINCENIRKIKISPENKYIAIISNEFISVYRIFDGQRIALIPRIPIDFFTIKVTDNERYIKFMMNPVYFIKAFDTLSKNFVELEQVVMPEEQNNEEDYILRNDKYKLYCNDKKYHLFDIALNQELNLPEGIDKIHKIKYLDSSEYSKKYCLIQRPKQLILYNIDTNIFITFNNEYDFLTIDNVILDKNESHLIIKKKSQIYDEKLRDNSLLFYIETQKEIFGNDCVVEYTHYKNYIITFTALDEDPASEFYYYLNIYDINSKILKSSKLKCEIQFSNINLTVKNDFIYLKDSIYEYYKLNVPNRIHLRIFNFNLEEIEVIENIKCFNDKNENFGIIKNESGQILIFDFKKCKKINHDAFESLGGNEKNFPVSGKRDFIAAYNDTKLILHKFDESILHKLNPYQIQLISSINFEYEKNKTENNEDKEIYLTKELTELFKTLPEYVQRCLRSNYNLASDYDLSLPIDRFNLIQSSLENNSELV